MVYSYVKVESEGKSDRENAKLDIHEQRDMSWNPFYLRRVFLFIASPQKTSFSFNPIYVLRSSSTTKFFTLTGYPPRRGGRQTKKNQKKRLALVRVTSRAEVDVIGVQRC